MEKQGLCLDGLRRKGLMGASSRSFWCSAKADGKLPDSFKSRLLRWVDKKTKETRPGMAAPCH